MGNGPVRPAAPRRGGMIGGVIAGERVPKWTARFVDWFLGLTVVGLGALSLVSAYREDSNVLPVLAVFAVFVAILVTGRFRRRDPLPLFIALVVGAPVITWVSGEPTWVLVLAAAFMVQAYEERQRLRWWLVGLTGGALILAALRLESGWAERIESAVVILAVIGWGQGVRASRQYRGELVQRAESAERERDLRAAQAVAAERARIARDIHDVVSHSLAVVVVQAAGAERVAEKQPEVAREALGVIAETARGALTEMRALLQVLREGDAAPENGAPSPGLPQIEPLAAEMSGRGLRVATSTTGTPYGLGAGAELAMYRVVQESLTNALKHGDRSGPTTLSIAYTPDELVVDVVNPLRRPESRGPGSMVDSVPGSGSGLTGMRERLGLYSGSIRAGVDGSDYRVRATIPRPPGDKRGRRADDATGGHA